MYSSVYSIICRGLGLVSADVSIAAKHHVWVISVMTLVWAIGTILISSFKALVSLAYRTIVNALVIFSILLLLNETALSYMALTEWWMAPAADGRGCWLGQAFTIQAHWAIAWLNLTAGLVGALWMVELCLNLHLFLLFGLVEFLIVGASEVGTISTRSIMVRNHNWVVLLWIWLILDYVMLVIWCLVFYSLRGVSNTHRPIHIAAF